MSTKLAKATASQMDDDSSSTSSDIPEDDGFRVSDDEFPMSDDDEYKDPAEADEPTSWATAMAKALKTKHTEVLSKAKKVEDIARIKKEKKGYGFEIEGEIKKEEKPDAAEIAAETKRQRMKERHERLMKVARIRVKPSITDRERERAFQKIATKGVVQLFNAVKTQQKDINEKLEKAGRLEYKRDEVLKNVSKKKFLDTLHAGPRAKSELVDNPVKVEPKKEVKEETESDYDSDDQPPPESLWRALKEDFLASHKREDSD